jgi:Patatin-like phospholipase
VKHSQRCQIVGCVLAALSLSSCTKSPTSAPIPPAFSSEAKIPEFPNIRQWGEAPATAPVDQNPQRTGSASGVPQGPLNVLAFSAGGANGAFGAGFMTGWTQTGTRPVFHVVTGVSIGALLAPMAFIGPQYDVAIARMLIDLSGKYRIALRPRFIAVFGLPLASSMPLEKLIAEYFDIKVLGEIASAHRAGRRLYVGTSHVYAGRFSVWDIGAIANSGRPEALALFHRILLASTAIPAVLPPVIFEVAAEKKTYHELHIDGGIMRQVFVSPYGFDWNIAQERLRTNGEINFYIIRNGRVRSEYMAMPLDAISLSQHAMLQLTQSVGIGDLDSLYLLAQTEHVNFHAAWIDDAFDAPSIELYDGKYVQALFKHGLAQAQSISAWHRLPPGIATSSLECEAHMNQSTDSYRGEKRSRLCRAK